MPGERFSTLYVRPGEFFQDSGRARHRIGALFGEAVLNNHATGIAVQLSRSIGVAVPGDGRHTSDWHAFIRECRTPEFLDMVTVVYRYLFWHVGDEVAYWWRDVLRQIFAEENLAYEIDDVGSVHPRVDREFQSNLASTVAALQIPRYQNIREFFERASDNLSADPPNYKQAWRATLSAVEALFQLMFPYAQVTVGEIERRLRPVVQRAYESDEAAQSAAQQMLVAFQAWFEASLRYCRPPGTAEPTQPPADIAILAISHGASLLRWLAGLDEDRPA